MNKKSTTLLATGLFVILAIIFYLNQETGERVMNQHSAQPSAPQTASDSGESFGISSSNEYANQVGMDILENGGNAVDAAVAVGFVLGVVEPYGSGLGGGGSMLILPPDADEPVSYDYREVAPQSEERQSIGVPGFVKGMDKVHADYGSIEMGQLLQPAIDFAEEGFDVSAQLSSRIRSAQARINREVASHYYPDGAAIQPGEPLIQEELSTTLKTLQANGLNDFYDGDVAAKIGNDDQSAIEREDLEAYEVETKTPVQGQFYDYDIYSASPPLAGIPFIQMLQMAESLHIEDYERGKADYIGLWSEISKVAYDDRLNTISDPNFNDHDVDELTSKAYSEALAEDISISGSGLSLDFNDSEAERNDHSNTTHFVIIDQDGMIVSATNTLSNFFGSGSMTGGFFLNNQLKNFSQSSQSPNAYEPGKKPRSFIAPTIMVNEETEEILGIGSPGGRRIPQILMQVVANQVLYEDDLQEAIDEPRFILEDNTVFLENDIGEEEIPLLRKKGYKVQLYEDDMFYGSVQSLAKKEQEIYGGSDPRRNGTWGSN
ncbi:gamma-glutamyltransferase [Shouchella sp. 1P09AA]|uniref:gamma-glutamyltransferase n=1 Tax=unclassified Shouchella TaxID=2893065 RepID=UPI0039A17920